jgi:hypothetical protein
MNGVKRFGGGRVPTGTPSLAWSSVVMVASLLTGASIVHNIYKPDMVRLYNPSTPATVHTTCSAQSLHEILLILSSFFFSLPAPADHSTCGDCQRRQGPGELSCEWLDTTCKIGWAWRSEEPAVNTFDIFLVQHKQRFVLWGDIVFATLRLLVAHNHGPWGYSVSCVHRFIHNHANVSNRQVYVYVFSSTLFFWSAMMIVMVS